MKSRIKTFYHFIGYRTSLYGAVGMAVGFLSFACDLALAMMLQRFFMSTGLVTLGTDMPFDVPLQSVEIEGIGLVAIGIIRGGALWLNGYLSGLCQTTIEVEKRQQLTRWAIVSDGQEVGTIMSFFNDIIIGAAAAIGGIFYMASRLILITGIFIVMLTYSLEMSLWILGLIAVLAPIQMAIDRVIRRNAKSIQSSLANAVSLLARALKNNLFLSLHNLTNHEIKSINRATDQYGCSSIKYFSLNAIRAILPQILGLIAVILIAIESHSSFKENPAILIAFLYMVLRFFQVLSDIARVGGNLRLNYPRIYLLLSWWKSNISTRNNSQNNDTINSDDTHNYGAVGWHADEINFTWPNGKKTAIENLSFEIKPCTTTLIVGASGTGKTTLFHILLGLLPPTNGHIMAIYQDGTKTLLDKRILQKISYVGPDPFLVAGTVRDQLLIGNSGKSDSDLLEALRKVQANFINDFPDGLNHILTEQGQGLSAGQKQRLSLARAILRQPDLLLLDEATANLDEQTELQIIEQVNALRGKISILIISHRPPVNLKIDQRIDLNQNNNPTDGKRKK